MSNDTQILRDPEGYLIDPEDWDEHVSETLAREESIDLNDQHWQILRFMRGYWEEHKIAPDVRHVTSHLVEAEGIDKKAAKQRLFNLFPYGYVKQACKISGMQRPRAWSSG